MVFVACGLNHKTAPLDVREKVVLSGRVQKHFLESLSGSSVVQEVVALSTCNRTEIYCRTSSPDEVIPAIARECGIDSEAISPYFYMHVGVSGIRHMLQVACGLDSMMLGEPQILGQMKQAYQQACQLGTVKEQLHSIFQQIFSASKRIRNQSGIGNNPVSVASAGAQLIGRFFSADATRSVLIIGTGEMGRLVAKYLHKQGMSRFVFASRSQENAQPLADAFQGEAVSITDIPNHLAQADVVVSATACPVPFIDKALVEQALSARAKAPMFFLDLAVPRDIAEEVAELEAVRLYNIDDLHQLVERGLEERRAAALLAEELIEQELEHFARRSRVRQAQGAICYYRDQMQELTQVELHRATQKLNAGQCQHAVLAEFGQRLLNKLTHQTTVGLRQTALDERDDLLDLARYLLNGATSVYEKIP